MRIGLIDIDYNGSFPNIPLMKISAWKKSQGHTVEWYMPFGDRYDAVYISKIFSWSKDYTDVINADIVWRGGSGYQIKMQDGKEVWDNMVLDQSTFYTQLLDEVEHIYPDYSLYPTLTKNTAYGFLTRGCPRKCSFCHVAAKEGTISRKVADLSEFWNGQKNIVICDPNILACKDWKPLLQQLIDSRAYVDINQGLDARMLTPEKCEMLNRIKMRDVHFAWDRYEDKKRVITGLKMFADRSLLVGKRHKAIVYILVNYSTTIDQDLERIYTVRDMGFVPYVMIYDKAHASHIYTDLACWANNKYIINKCPSFDQYDHRIKNSNENQNQQLEIF